MSKKPTPRYHEPNGASRSDGAFRVGPSSNFGQSETDALRAIVDDVLFIAKIADAKAQYLSMLKREAEEPGIADVRKTLSDIQAKAQALYGAVTRVDLRIAKMVRDSGRHRSNCFSQTWKKRLSTDLLDLEEAIEIARRGIESENGRPTNKAQRGLVFQVAQILDEYGIELTDYNQGDFNMCLRIAADKGDNDTTTRNWVADYLRWRKS